jgi:hypothetical protein
MARTCWVVIKNDIGHEEIRRYTHNRVLALEKVVLVLCH